MADSYPNTPNITRYLLRCAGAAALTLWGVGRCAGCTGCCTPSTRPPAQAPAPARRSTTRSGTLCCTGLAGETCDRSLARPQADRASDHRRRKLLSVCLASFSASRRCLARRMAHLHGLLSGAMDVARTLAPYRVASFRRSGSLSNSPLAAAGSGYSTADLAGAGAGGGCSVLVHCSDGWDRTAQICALAQLVRGRRETGKGG